MNAVSENRDNFCVTYTKEEVEDLLLINDCCLDFDFEGEEKYYRMERSLKKQIKLFEDYIKRNGKPELGV